MENIYSWAEDGANAMLLPATDLMALGDDAQHDVVFVIGARASTCCAETCAAHDSWSQCYSLDDKDIKAMTDAGKRAVKTLALSLGGKIDPEDSSSFEATDEGPGLYLLAGSGVADARLMLGRALAPDEAYTPTGRVEVHRPRAATGEHPFAYAGVVVAHARQQGDPAVRVELTPRALKPLRVLPELVALMGGGAAELLLVPSAIPAA